MGFRAFRRMRVLAVSLTTVTATATLFAIAGTAGPVSAATSNGCPSSKTLAGLPTASNVAAGFSNSGSTSTYTFASLTNESGSGYVPGLVKYCVYPSPVSQPTGVTVAAHGWNSASWVSAKGSNNFAFMRPGGNKTNIPLNGKTTTMGSAVWGTPPDSQIIILHINDPTVCASLFPGSTSLTCFVKPSPLGPVCNAGDTNVAYNAMPTDVVNCRAPAIGFEGTSTNEFGDRVTLAIGTPTAPSDVKLKVDFQSYACETSGHWSGTTQDAANLPSPCVTADAGATFTHSITANLYDPNGSGGFATPIASVTTTQTIPYRPSADTTGHCTGALGTTNASSKFWNPNAVGGGACQNSIGTVLMFDFGSVASLPKDVVWTVAFNTSTSGYAPLGTATSCALDYAANDQNPGCPYDSLNVGDNSFPNAPYAGTDPIEDTAYISQGGKTAPLQSQSGWTGLRPLGEIITTP